MYRLAVISFWCPLEYVGALCVTYCGVCCYFLFGDVCGVAAWVYAGKWGCCLSWRVGELFSPFDLCILLRRSLVCTGMWLYCIRDYVCVC